MNPDVFQVRLSVARINDEQLTSFCVRSIFSLAGVESTTSYSCSFVGFTNCR